MISGIKCRFNDVQEMLSFNPEFLEFHFSDKDLEEEIPNLKISRGIMVHAPEYLNYKLVDIASAGETNQILSREQSVEVVKRTIEKAVELSEKFKGRPAIIIHPGGYSIDNVSKETKSAMIESLKTSVKEILNEKADIYLENLPPFPWFFGGQYICNVFLDALEIKEFCSETSIKICFDTSHCQLYCNYSKKNILDEIKILNQYIAHLHISDASGFDGEGLQIEEGEINWGEVMPLLRENNNITFVPEIWKGHEKDGLGFKIAFERLKKYI